MNVAIGSTKTLRGVAAVPGDKSIAHRALLFGALANGWTRITGVPRGADVSATMRALGSCGVQVQCNGDAVIVQGAGREAMRTDGVTIDCGNSGTTMRLLMGVLAGQSGTARLVGDDSLSRRPMRRVAEPLRLMGAAIETTAEGFAPLHVTGTANLQAADHDLTVPSAQLKSALLLAGLGAQGRTRLRGALHSRDHTERMLPQFGVRVQTSKEEISIEGGQQLRGVFLQVPGDPSSAAFLVAAAVLVNDGEIEVRDVLLNPTRLGFVHVLRRMGAHIEIEAHREHPEPVGTIFARSSSLHATTIEAHEVPSVIDELPLLALAATQAEGTTVIRGAAELRVKESDRIDAVARALQAMGVRIETFEDGFTVEGPQPLAAAVIDPRRDHRIAMTAAVAGLISRGEVRVSDAGCAGVSFPGFYTQLQGLGARVA